MHLWLIGFMSCIGKCLHFKVKRAGLHADYLGSEGIQPWVDAAL